MSYATSLVCAECGPDALVQEDAHEGNFYCMSCGLVLGERLIDERSEWRSFTDDNPKDDPNRVGSAAHPLLDAHSLTTSITVKNGPMYSENDLVAAKELRKMQNEEASNLDERQILDACTKIKAIAGNLSLTKMERDEAQGIFKKLFDLKAVRGFPRQAVAAVCVYCGCAICHVPRTTKEIVAASNVKTRDFNRVLSAVKSLQEDGRNVVVLPVVSATAVLPRFCSLLNLDAYANDIVAVAEGAVEKDLFLTSRAPTSVAGASIYLICQAGPDAIRHSLSEISKVCGPAEGTIKDTYKELVARATEVAPARYHDRIKRLATER